MDSKRLEAFTDGVFAIVVTLLVLDIKLPDGTTADNLENNIIHILPSLGTYFLSFLVVGLYWIFHHRASHYFKSSDTPVLWLNLVYLMFIALIPFSASMLSKFIYTPWAILFYGVNLLLITLSGWLIFLYLYRHKNLVQGEITPEIFRAQRHHYLKIAYLYAIGIISGFYLPRISIYIYVIVTLNLILGTLSTKFSWQRRIKNNTLGVSK